MEYSNQKYIFSLKVNLPILKLIDKEWFHLSDDSIKNPYINWYRGGDDQEFILFTDKCYKDVGKYRGVKKIAWLLESPGINKKYYRRIVKYANQFDRILTFDKTLLRRGHPFCFCPCGGSWIDEKDRGIVPKSENLSIILSDMKLLVGHRLRHIILQKYRAHFDGVYGRGINPIDKKVLGLKNYRYSIVCENCKEDYYFSEKIIDCFVTGTVPIYWGCPSVSKFFDGAGIIEFDSVNDLKSILSFISEDDYGKRMDAIKRNYNLALNYIYPEKFIRGEVDMLSL